MSVLTSSPQPHPPHIRPPSRSERLLRDTLRKDDTLRTITSPHARPSSTCSCDPEEDENLFQSTLLLRSTRRNSATSISSSRSRSRAHTHPRSCYIPDDDEHTSYARLLRSSSFSGSFRSKRSEPKSPQYTSLALEKQEDAPLHVHDAPHEAVLRTRLEHVLHLGMREVKREAGTSSIESSAGSPPTSLLSLSNSRHSHESEHTHLTTPEGDAHKPSTPPPQLSQRDTNGHHLARGHHVTRSVSSAIPGTIESHERAPRSPRSLLPTTPGRSPHSPQHYQKQSLHTHVHPSSPWLTTPLPPSPPVFAATPTKRASPVIAPVDASPPSLVYQTYSRSRTPAPVQSSPRSPPTYRSHTPQATYTRAHHSPHTPTPVFDPKAASLACQQVPGYVSFASVAGLGAPPDEDDRHSGRTVGFSGKSALLGFGGGKWWAF